MNIVLLSCTKRKKDYPCIASEMYSESAIFRKAYEYAKLKADKIFILSAKYGLLDEDTPIKPYELTLNNQNADFKKRWSNYVLKNLKIKTNMEKDNFIFITGINYYQDLISSINHFEFPLYKKSLGYWIPTLNDLIANYNKNIAAKDIHELFSKSKKYNYESIKTIPFENGIYVMYDKTETFEGGERIVRVGTHTGQGNLKSRLHSHFASHQRSSIFRRNIGRVYLIKNNPNYLSIWNSDSKNINKDVEYEKALESEITTYLCKHISFIVFPVFNKETRLHLENGIISSLNHDPAFKPTSNWYGNGSPIFKIAQSGLWCVAGLESDLLSFNEFNQIKNILFNDNYTPVITKTKSVLPKSNKSDRIREYIHNTIINAKQKNKPYIDLISGDIHRSLSLKNCMPSVCNVMYKINGYQYDILHTTPSGKSSTIKIRYYIK